MSFHLLCIDIIPSDKTYGITIGMFKLYDKDLNRALFSIDYWDGEWTVDLLWCRVVGG